MDKEPTRQVRPKLRKKLSSLTAKAESNPEKPFRERERKLVGPGVELDRSVGMDDGDEAQRKEE